MLALFSLLASILFRLMMGTPLSSPRPPPPKTIYFGRGAFAFMLSPWSLSPCQEQVMENGQSLVDRLPRPSPPASPWPYLALPPSLA